MLPWWNLLKVERESDKRESAAFKRENIPLKGRTVLKKALMVWGGWEGRRTEAVSNILANMLRSEQFEVTLSNTLDSFSDISLMQSMDLIVPNWTNGRIAKQPLSNLIETIQNGRI